MKLPIYLDHHATTPCDGGIIDLMVPYFGVDKFGNASSKNNHHGRMAAQALKTAKGQIAALINGNPDHIVLTSGATEANALALQNLQAQGDRREVLIGALEHASIMDQIPNLTARGFHVRIIPGTGAGVVTAQAVENLINHNVALVCVMLGNHEIGTIQPIRAIADIAHGCGALLHCDATQALGKIAVDVAALGVDSASFSAHKIYGPQGVGALYTNHPAHRAGTAPLALAVGFGAACAMAAERMAGDEKHLRELTELLLQLLPICGVNGGLDAPRLPGVLNINFPGINADDALLDLIDDLSLSTGAACASGTGKPSAVLRAIGLDDVLIASSIRISVGRGTTRDEVIYATEKLNEIYLRMMDQRGLSKKSALS